MTQIEIENLKIRVDFFFSKEGLNKLENNLELMGFNNKEDFDGLLGKLVIFRDKKVEEKDKIINYLAETAKLCSKALNNEEINVFLFETNDDFITHKMEGSSGFCTNHNCILILVNLETFNKIAIMNTFAHELAHSLNKYYNMGYMSIGEGLVFDGVAENFRETFIDNRRSKIVSSISKKDAEKLIEDIKPILKSRKFNDYYEVFFGKGKYPLWAGYSIGYYLIKKYLSDLKDFDWNKILKKEPNEILNKII